MNKPPVFLNSHIDIEQLIRLPGKIHVYWKDIDSTYLGCNDLLAEHANIASRQDILGTNDFDYACYRNEAELWRSHDREVLETNTPKHFFHPIHLENLTCDSLDFKMPLYNPEGQIIGSLGISYLLNVDYKNNNIKKGLDTFLYHLEQMDEIFSRYSIQLSHRQLQCVFYLLKGMTAKEIAKELDLSYRTIEAYIDDIKIKFNCHKRVQLISKIHFLLFNHNAK